jgi:signal transduction histidine kinase
VLHDRHREIDTERATMRVRLVGLALASTLLVLAPRSDQVAAGAVLLGYAAIVAALRFALPRAGAPILAPVGILIDVAFATAVVMLLPRSGPSWAVYSIAIATGALRYGVHGTAAATAAAVVAYDATLVLLPGEAGVLDLFPVQVLLAFGVFATELVWAVSRSGRERTILRARALAQRDLAARTTSDELLSSLVEHAVRTFGARAAWIESANGGPAPVVLHARGRMAEAGAAATQDLRIPLALDPRTDLVASFDAATNDGQRVALADLARDEAPLFARFTEHDRLAARVDELDARVVELRDELQGRDDAVASAVHELRTPLTSVQAYGQVMSRNLQAVQRQVGQLDRLLGDLLQTQAGAPRLDLAEVDLWREARDAASRLRLVTGVDVNVPADDGERYLVQADAGRLAQVLDNLLRNAAKFSPPEESIDVELRRDGDEIVFSVTDRGEGIPPEELSRIFERYYRGTAQHRSVPGEGIGLTVSHEIITAHGGRIWATSAGPGRGSTFSIALPALFAPPPNSP